MAAVSRRDLIGTGASLAAVGFAREASAAEVGVGAAPKPDRWTERVRQQDFLLAQRLSDEWKKIKDVDFDVVIIGAGTFGGYLADKIYRLCPSIARLKVLVIEWGGCIINSHYQNIGEHITKTIVGYPPPSTGDDLTKIRSDFWNTPWTSNEKFRGLATCVGGRSIVWAGWSPRLERADLKLWPADIGEWLVSDPEGYTWVEREIGASQLADYIKNTALFEAVSATLAASLPKVLDLAGQRNVLTRVQDAPLAVSASAPQSGLFPFNKFSSLVFLGNAICEDRWERDWLDGDVVSEKDISKRNLFLLKTARVLRLHRSNDGKRVESIDLDIAGETNAQSLRIKSGAVVVLANGTIEATRIALNDLGIAPATGMAENLMAHLRSNVTVRISREAFQRFYPKLPDNPAPGNQEIAAFLVRGEDPSLNRRFHFQVVAASLQKPEQGKDPGRLLWKMVPDGEVLQALLNNRGDQIAVSFNLVGEMSRKKDGGVSFITTGPEASDDPYKVRRAKVTLTANQTDLTLWKTMELAALRLAWHMAGEKDNNITYPIRMPDNTWATLQQIEANYDKIVGTQLRDGIGLSHHEAGPLLMGDDPSSVTDLDGKFRHLENVYVAGPAIFPTVGSANPTLTGLALTRRLANRFANTLAKEKYKKLQVVAGTFGLPADQTQTLLSAPAPEMLALTLTNKKAQEHEQEFAELLAQARAAEVNNP